MWSLYVPAENLFLLKKEAHFCGGCAGKTKGSLQHNKQVWLHLKGTSVSYITVNADSVHIF
jgi:hypothetical protein